MQVRRLLFREMGSYNDMAVRPFNPSFKPRHEEQLLELTRDGQDLSPGILGALAGEIMRPSSKVEGIAGIANGWGERRLMFIMEVVVRNSPTSTTLEMLTGYTDYVGLSNLSAKGVTIDPDMRLYFSSRFEVMQLEALGRNGRETITTIRDAAQVLSRRTRPDLSMPQGHNGTITLRPEDLFVRNTVPDTLHELALGDGYRDMRSSFSQHSMKLSSRINTQASQYLSRTLKAYRAADPDNFMGDPTEENPETARMIAGRESVREPLITTKTAFEFMKQDSDILRSGYITWGELLAMNPALDDIADVYVPMKGETMHRRGDTSNWGDPDNETIAATIIANTIPTYLMECMYSEIRFNATNNTMGGVVEVRVPRLLPFMQGAEIDQYYHPLVHRIETQLIPDISLNGALIVDVEVWCSINGDTHINISIDGDEPRDFVFPTFCESVASPMLTDQPAVLDVLSRDIGAIADTLSHKPRRTLSERAPSHRSPLRGKTL